MKDLTSSVTVFRLIDIAFIVTLSVLSMIALGISLKLFVEGVMKHDMD